MIVPSGKRRQMESQSYLWNEHEKQVDGIIEKMLHKAAELGVDPSAAAGITGQPTKPKTEPVRGPEQTGEIADAMNQSNGLPPKDIATKEPPAASAGTPSSGS